MRPIDYVTCAILANYPDGLTSAELEREVKRFLSDRNAVHFGWYLLINEDRIRRAKEVTEAHNWFQSSLRIYERTNSSKSVVKNWRSSLETLPSAGPRNDYRVLRCLVQAWFRQSCIAAFLDRMKSETNPSSQSPSSLSSQTKFLTPQELSRFLTSMFGGNQMHWERRYNTCNWSRS